MKILAAILALSLSPAFAAEGCCGVSTAFASTRLGVSTAAVASPVVVPVLAFNYELTEEIDRGLYGSGNLQDASLILATVNQAVDTTVCHPENVNARLWMAIVAQAAEGLHDANLVNAVNAAIRPDDTEAITALSYGREVSCDTAKVTDAQGKVLWHP